MNHQIIPSMESCVWSGINLSFRALTNGHLAASIFTNCRGRSVLARQCWCSSWDPLVGNVDRCVGTNRTTGLQLHSFSSNKVAFSLNLRSISISPSHLRSNCWVRLQRWLPPSLHGSQRCLASRLSCFSIFLVLPRL